MLKLHVVIASTRPGRIGLPIGAWAYEHAQAHGSFAVRLVDLKEVALPIYDEPKHPRLGAYEHAHTKAWSATVKEADAFVFVTPEYNFSPAPSLLNALAYLYIEWSYKPAALVSYGGISGGLRAAQAVKLTLTALKMMPMVESVTLPFAAKQIKDGSFDPSDANKEAATAMLNELHRWAGALRPLRG